MANIDEGYSKTELLKTDWSERPRDVGQLYDLLLDPNEANNVADNPRYHEAVIDMEQRLSRWMTRTNDPLLRGPLTIPAGATINTRQSRDPAAGPFVSA